MCTFTGGGGGTAKVGYQKKKNNANRVTFTCLTTILKYTRRAVTPQLKLPDSQVSKYFHPSRAAEEIRGVRAPWFPLREAVMEGDGR